ncbi:hypothetical protein [Flavobacterium sp. 3-210]
MNYDKIKEQFIKETEALLKIKREEINLLTGQENITAKMFHLDNNKQFSQLLNIKINRIVNENKIAFKSQAEGDEFSAFMKPTFDKLFKDYTDIAKS